MKVKDVLETLNSIDKVKQILLDTPDENIRIFITSDIAKLILKIFDEYESDILQMDVIRRLVMRLIGRNGWLSIILRSEAIQMTTEQMRSRLERAYPGPRWRLRVMEMPESQVIAVYKSMLETDRFTKKKRLKREPGITKAVQLSIFDLPEMKSI